MTRVGINGLGRIGRIVFRKLVEIQDVNLVMVNDIMPIETFVYLLKFDSNHGVFPTDISIQEGNVILIGHKNIKYTSFANL